MSDVIHKQSRQHNQDEDAPHAFQGMHPHNFDIQAVFLVEAIRVFNLGTMVPLGVHGFGIGSGVDGDVGEQDQITIQVRVVGNQGPQHLLRLRKPDHQPAEGDVHDSHLAGVGEGHTESQWQRYGGRQVVQQFLFPGVGVGVGVGVAVAVGVTVDHG